ncbi:MAG: phosphate ABC transporter substrate-binding protein PstS [Xanthomonadales bacterium]|nr:MAG: phosphate ABC transporter substrate-binding protein PstS [Dokdonella sp.]MBC6942744.1 phosphate ABC transporter substrate-binding protein PstS [Xanthomonadales bacterium]MCC6596386.1 phosphate ABC transporter substrate-binding protein PstS [Rhodanobacteraceae bacterium]MDL1868086.1 phosphate ABC transporter substrate-binding protein PstS [Gammaproteobacteria bacterium PRO6]
MNPSFRRTLQCLSMAAAFVLGARGAQAADITGAGSSFVYPLISKWSASYADKTGHRINYQSIGSGGGMAQIKAGTVDFGASDMPLDEATLKQYGLGQFPDAIGGIVPALNVEGVAPGQLLLDGNTLADIFLGRITRWNDAAILALNPGLDLPAANITVVHRSDGSGTSYHFTHYLSKVSSAWNASVGAGSTVQWPGGIGGKGNEGVAAYVRQIPHSIGYVEYAYARKNHIAHARLRNAAGTAVEPNMASFQAAAASADWDNSPHFSLLMLDAPGSDAWPITAASWVIMPVQPKNAANHAVALDFFEWAYTHGQDQARTLDYVPLPESLVTRIRTYWKSRFQR